MIRVSENSLLNISRYENDLARLSFISQSGMAFSMNRLNANMMSSTHAEFLSDFENDITDTASMIEKLQKAINASNGDYISDGINLGDLFDIDRETGTIEVLGFGIKKGVTNVDKARIKKRLVEKIINIDYEDYKAALKVARSKKADEVSLPINPSEKEKFLYLALKAVGGRVYKVTSKIQKELNSYRKLRMDYTPEELNLIDSKINGFTRTMVDGVIQNSTYFTANEVIQISTKHQKDIGAMDYIRKMQEQLKQTGIIAIEIDSDDSLGKMYNLLKDAEQFTLNTKTGFVLKSRKLGNYTKKDTELFGMFLPDSKIIALDSRDPSALSHEYSHAIDFNNDFIDDGIRSSFISVMKSFLDKGYVDDFSSGDVVDCYIALNNDDFKKDIMERLDSLPSDIIEPLKDDNVKLATHILSERNRKMFANSIERELRSNLYGFSREEASKMRDIYMNAFNDISVPENNGDYIAKNILSGRFSVAGESLGEDLISYVNFRGKKNFDKLEEKPSDYSYLSKPVEIIARAGELGFVLSKYGYEGHKTQEELELFFDKVRKIQEEEMRTSKKIRGCHHIDQYLDRPAYFGFRDMKEDSMMLIKDFYKPFFKPKNVFDMANNGEVVISQNNESMRTMSNERFRKLVENIMTMEFDQQVKQKEKRNRKMTAKSSRFNKDEYPMSHLRSYDDLESMIRVNEEEKIVSNTELGRYIIENIKLLDRTQKKENIDPEKLKRRLDTFATLLASKESFDGFGKTLEKMIVGLGENKKNLSVNGIISSFDHRENEEIGMIRAASSDIMDLTFRGSAIGVKEIALKLKEMDPSEIEGSYESFNNFLTEGVNLRKESNVKNNLSLDLEFIAAESHIKELEDLISEDLDGVNVYDSKEAKSYFILKAISRLSPLTSVVDWRGDYEDSLKNIDFSEAVDEDERFIIEEFAEKSSIPAQDYHYEDRRDEIVRKVRYMRPRDEIVTSGINQEVDFNIFDDKTKLEIFNHLERRSSIASVYTAKSHEPKKSVQSDEDKIEFLSGKKFNNINKDEMIRILEHFYNKDNLSQGEINNVGVIASKTCRYDVRVNVNKRAQEFTDREEKHVFMSKVRRIENFLDGSENGLDLIKDVESFIKEYGRSKTAVKSSDERRPIINKEEVLHEANKSIETIFDRIEQVAEDAGVRQFLREKMGTSLTAEKNSITPVAIAYGAIEKMLKKTEGNPFLELNNEDNNKNRNKNIVSRK